MLQHFSQNHTRVQRDIFVLVTRERGEQDLALSRDIFDRRPARTDLAAEEEIEYLDDVLAGLEVEFGDVHDEEVEEVGAVCFL